MVLSRSSHYTNTLYSIPQLGFIWTFFIIILGLWGFGGKMIGAKYYNHDIISNDTTSLVMFPWSSNQGHNYHVSPLGSHSAPSFPHCTLQKEVTTHRLYLKSKELIIHESLEGGVSAKIIWDSSGWEIYLYCPLATVTFILCNSIFLLLVQFLEPMLKWNHTVFISLSLSLWLILLSIIPSRAIHVTNGEISLFFMTE